MDANDYTARIVDGMELYFRTLGLAKNMRHHSGDIEWIAPEPNANGPAIVFRVALDEATASERIEELIPDLNAGSVPAFWFLSPTSTPANIVEILRDKGFSGGDPNPEDPEMGMALDLRMTDIPPASHPSIKIRKVQSFSDFSVWVDVVNEALHGWKMLDAANYFALVSREGVAFYLASLDGKPMATAATMHDGQTAGLEFVGTLQAYRRRGAASAICVEALRQLQANGVHIVTLRAAPEAIHLYTKLGFTPYFVTRGMTYHGNEFSD